MSDKLWGGRFADQGGRAAEGFTASLTFDQRLWPEDLKGSRAHVRMLGRQGIIGLDEAEQILKGLDQIEQELRSGDFVFDVAHEDIHMAIEARLHELVGPVAGKLHTARSRNDQVALDEHLYLQRAAHDVGVQLTALQEVLLEQAQKHQHTLCPGYTHTQRAQPMLLGHHLLAFFFMLDRDQDRLQTMAQWARRSPLGAAALAGTSHPIDPISVAVELGLDKVYENSLDAVSDRDDLLNMLFALAMIGQHLSRMAEELVLWSSSEFGFVELSDRFARGSSIMPQKKNPDPAELIRGKTGRLIGALVALLTVVKGLPLGYNSDLQEDKEQLFDAVDTVLGSLETMTGIWREIQVHKDRLAEAAGGFATATDLADALAQRGIPFREAHRRVGSLVGKLSQEGREFTDMGPSEWSEAFPELGAEAAALADPWTCVAARRSPGGTAPEALDGALQAASARLKAQQAAWRQK